MRCCLLLPMLALLACAPPPYEVSTGPAVTITWPPPETTYTACVTVVVEVENFDFVEGVSENEDGQGHLHVEHPAGYAVCYRPYCLVDLTQVTSANPTLTAVLANNDHSPVLNEEGLRVETSVPIILNQDGPCSEGTPSGGYGGDTGDMGDSG